MPIYLETGRIEGYVRCSKQSRRGVEDTRHSGEYHEQQVPADEDDVYAQGATFGRFLK